MKLRLAACLVFANWVGLNAQTSVQSTYIASLGNTIGATISLNLEVRGLDAEQHQSMALCPLFDLNTSSLEVSAPIDISAEMPGQDIPHRSVIIPQNHLTKLAYGYFYQNNGQNTFAPNHTLFLVEYQGNAPTWKGKSRIWVDVNHDFNFSNDSAYWLMNGVSSVKLPMTPGNKPLAMEVMPFPFKQFRQFSNMTDTGIMWLQTPHRKYLGTRYSFKEVRWNLWFQRFIFDGDTLKIGLKDVDCNGRYNDESIDRVYLTGADNQLFPSKNGVVLKGKTQLHWMGHSFELTVVDGVNAQVELKLIKSIGNESSLSVGQKIPRFKFCVANKPVYRKQIRKVKAKYTYVYVWSADNEQFLADSSEMHSIQRSIPQQKVDGQTEFQIVMLNYGGSGRYVYNYNRRWDVNFFQGFCSPKIAKKLKLQSMPQSFLLDENHRIIKIGMSPKKFRQFILRNKKHLSLICPEF